jgi:hypothetical protein
MTMNGMRDDYAEERSLLIDEDVGDGGDGRRRGKPSAVVRLKHTM